MKISKSIIRSLLICLVAIGFITLTSCGGGGGGDEGPIPANVQELAFEKLSGAWDFGVNGSIILDGQDETLNYAGFSLSFTDGGYTTTAAGSLFRSSGTWTWADATAANQVTLDDGKVVAINSLTTTNFNFSFAHSNNTGGVANGVNGVQGNYTINVNK